MQFTWGCVWELKNNHNSVTVQNWTHVYMNFFDHKNLGNHLLQSCPKVMKHPVYSNTCNCSTGPKSHTYPRISFHVLSSIHLTGHLNLISDTCMSYLPQPLHFNISCSILLLVLGAQLSVLPKSNFDLEFKHELPNYNDQEQRQYTN